MPSRMRRSTALEKAGQPVVRISVPNIYELGQEFFRWEIATAVAGSIIGINAFNQPDVEASKIETRKLTDEYEKTGSLPPESPVFEEGGIKLFTDEKNAAALKQSARDATLVGYLRAHLEPSQRRRLFRPARLHPDERRASNRAPVDSPRRPRQEARGHLPRLRPALPALDRPGLQRRP